MTKVVGKYRYHWGLRLVEFFFGSLGVVGVSDGF